MENYVSGQWSDLTMIANGWR